MQRAASRYFGHCSLEMRLDLAKLGCAAVLFASPWMLRLDGVPAWNLWIFGYAILTVSGTALLAEAAWEPRTNFLLGAWVMAAPWTLGFDQESAAAFVHLSGGSVVAILSAVELLGAESNPPWRFRPGSALRAPASQPAMSILVPASLATRKRRPLATNRGCGHEKSRAVRPQTLRPRSRRPAPPDAGLRASA